MKKILHILGALQRGGAETMIMNVYRVINKDEYQFDFIVRKHVDNGYEEEIRKMGGNIFCIPSPKEIGLIKCILEHRKIMKKYGKYDAVHSHINAMSFIGMIAAKISGIKIRISHCHSSQFPGKIKSLIGRMLIACFSTKLVSCSKESGIALFGRHKFEIIPNGLNIDNYYLDSPKEKEKYEKKFNMKNNCIKICHIGRFIEVKNHSFIINLARELKKRNFNFQLFLLGNGDLYDKIVADAKDLKEVIFVGSVPNVNEYLKGMDLLIMPSLFEGFPVTLVEAQASGLACVVSKNITKDVDFNLGLINFLDLNINEWADFIIKNDFKRLYDKKRIVDVLTKNNFNIQDSAKKMLELYEK